MKNMLLINDKYIIDWTEKCGCTVVIKMFFQSIGLLEDALEYNSWIHNYREEKFYEKFGRVTKEMLSSNEYIKIKFVRNPYNRIVSSYFAAHENNKQFLPGYDHLDLTFYDFLKLVKEKKLANDHWRSQYQEIESEFSFDEVIQIENLDMEVERLNKKYDLNLKIDSCSGHHHAKDKSINDFVGRKRHSQYDDVKNIPDYINFYDEEIKQLVSEIYEMDLKTYGYDWNLGELPNNSKETIVKEPENQLGSANKIFDNKLNYITIWENEWHEDTIDIFLEKIRDHNICTIVFDIRWGNHELVEGEFDFSKTHEICKKIVKYGFKLMPLISIYYCPNWLYTKCESVIEHNETLGKVGPEKSGVSCVSKLTRKLALKFTEKSLQEINQYRENILSVSVSWNNEHETKFTQTHDLFRPYEEVAQEKFRSLVQNKNKSIEYWNSRWNTSYNSISDIELPIMRGLPQSDAFNRFKEDGQFIFDFYEFRRCLLIDIYGEHCRKIQSHGFQTWLHFGEMFTVVDAIYQGDVVFDMMSKNWLDVVVIDSNLSKIGKEENDPFVVYIIVSACMQYDKQVIFELAVEREKSISGYLQGIKYAKKKNLDGIGITNIIQNSDFSEHPEKILIALDEDKDLSTTNLFDSRWQNRILLIHPIRGSLVLMRSQKHFSTSPYVDPIQDYLMEEVKSWYDRGYDVNIIGDPSRLKTINPNAFNEILFLEPLALLSSDEKNISDFVERLPSDKPYHVKKLDSKFFEHQTGFDGKPLKFLDLNLEK